MEVKTQPIPSPIHIQIHGIIQDPSTASDGLGLQNSTTLNANFLKDGEAEVPNFRLELNDSNYIVDGYVEEGYVEVRSRG